MSYTAVDNFDDAVATTGEIDIVGNDQEPRVAFAVHLLIISNTLSADFVSRLPVGSSANISAGFIDSARAIATRCC